MCASQTASETFAPLGSIGAPREGHAATRLKDGAVLIVGGIDIGDAGAIPVTFGLVYEP